MSKELECLDRIDKRNYLTEREHKEFLGVVEKAIKEYEAIKNADSTKAMECLETIWCDISTNYINEYIAIKQALQRLEAIDNAEPTKALECLERIKTQLFGYFKSTEARTDDVEDYEKLFFEPIKQALIQAEQDKKKAECWDIVVKKRVNLYCIELSNSVEEYNKNYSTDKLTEEEFNLLKEVLE